MMEPFTIALALAEYAPQLIKWVTGNDKAEKVASIAVDVAKKVTGATSGDGALELIKADPKLAAEFADRIEQRSYELQIAYLADVDSARRMQIAALAQSDVFSKRFVYYFAIAWSSFAMLYFTFVTFGTVSQSGQRMADTILGVLIGTVITGFFNFFYGSSARSREKDDTIKQLSKGA
jgi:hypothetical protein